MRIKRGRSTFTAYVEDTSGTEHEVEVSYRGYSDHGVLYGPPERCYPPEGEVEIECKLPQGIDFGDLDKLHERLEDQAWELVCEGGRDE